MRACGERERERKEREGERERERENKRKKESQCLMRCSMASNVLAELNFYESMEVYSSCFIHYMM